MLQGVKGYPCTCYGIKHSFFSISTSCQWGGRRCGLMFSTLDPRVSGLWGSLFDPRPGTALCSWARYFTSIVPLFTQLLQVYEWSLINLILMENPAIEKHTIQGVAGRRNAPSRFMLQMGLLDVCRLYLPYQLLIARIFLSLKGRGDTMFHLGHLPDIEADIHGVLNKKLSFFIGVSSERGGRGSELSYM